MKKLKVWHIHVNKYSRAFAKPRNILECIAFLIKGWRPFNAYWWSKPSKTLKDIL